MNKLKLKIATQEYVVYFYIPEGEGVPGEIRMNIGDDEVASGFWFFAAEGSAMMYDIRSKPMV